MKLQRLPLLAAGLLWAGAAHAQVSLNELYVSQAGVDDDEFIELFGAPGTSLDGLLICAVEGDLNSATGNLDDVWDLTGNQFTASSPYFVMGTTSIGVNANLVVGGSNLFENSSQTIYLLSIPDPNLRATVVSVWINTDIRTAVGATTTMFSTTPGITILDHVALLDAGVGDIAFDGALAIGPDGTFFPAGAFRTGDCPNNWCTNEFLAFAWDPDGSSNGGMIVTGQPNDPTPGAMNYVSPSCMTAASSGTCSGGASIGSSYCTPNANSTGATTLLAARGSVLVASNDVTLRSSRMPLNVFGFFLASRDAGFVANPGNSQGNLCLAGSIGRFTAPGQIQISGTTGAIELMLNLNSIPQPNMFVAVIAGETWRFQCWHRDDVGAGPTSNFSNGVAIAFN